MLGPNMGFALGELGKIRRGQTFSLEIHTLSELLIYIG
mgnify:FL=1